MSQQGEKQGMGAGSGGGSKDFALCRTLSLVLRPLGKFNNPEVMCFATQFINISLNGFIALIHKGKLNHNLLWKNPIKLQETCC